MARKHKPEDIIGKLREAEIVLVQGETVADVCRRISVEAATPNRAAAARQLSPSSTAARSRERKSIARGYAIHAGLLHQHGFSIRNHTRREWVQNGRKPL